MKLKKSFFRINVCVYLLEKSGIKLYDKPVQLIQMLRHYLIIDKPKCIDWLFELKKTQVIGIVCCERYYFKDTQIFWQI